AHRACAGCSRCPVQRWHLATPRRAGLPCRVASAMWGLPSLPVTTGTTANIPPVMEGIPAWDSQDATAAQDIPTRLAIIGGGPVACEAATWMAALGSKVTMLVREGTLLTGDRKSVV